MFEYAHRWPQLAGRAGVSDAEAVELLDHRDRELEDYLRGFQPGDGVAFSFPGVLTVIESGAAPLLTDRVFTKCRATRTEGTGDTDLDIMVDGSTVETVTIPGTDLDTGVLTVSVTVTVGEALTVAATALGGARTVYLGLL